VKPLYLLCSYFYFKNKPIQTFIESVGYQPKILLDSGAYSAYTQGKNISLVDYMEYIKQNESYLHGYISLDVLGDPITTRYYYKIMNLKGIDPIPVYHYRDPEEVLEEYLNGGAQKVALGGTVPEKNKTKVIQWIQGLIERYPGIHFHLLGSSSKRILEINGLHSCDSSTWIMMAAHGFPIHLSGRSRQAKINRLIYNMQQLAG
jgi:hypothetical protein